MTMSQPYEQLIRFKQWADAGLHAVIGGAFDRLGPEQASTMLRILDHIHVVDRIFQHHLLRWPQVDQAPRSDGLPDLARLSEDTRILDDWYVAHVATLTADDLAEPLAFTYTSGRPARMSRGEIILHVCLHGTYHRGNAGLLLQTSGIAPNDDRLTDFLEVAL